MPYPMSKAPTFAEFKHRLQSEFGCEYKHLPGLLAPPDGPPEPVNYFERTVGGQTWTYSITLPDDERLTPSVIRTVCDALKVDKTKFGLTLG